MGARIDVADAVKAAVSVFGSFGPAKVKLIETCAAGNIQAFWRGHYLGQSPLIHRQRWIGADIDEGGVVITGDGERMRFVDLERSDYETWLAKQQSSGTTSTPPNNSRRRRQNQRDRAREAIAAKWPEGIPPQHQLSNSLLCREVNEWVKEDCARRDITFREIGDDTIERAAGRRQ